MDTIIERNDEDDIRLWDELNVQQCKEIELYENARLLAEQKHYIIRTVSYLLRSFTYQSYNELCRLRDIVYDAAIESYMEQINENKHYYYNNNTTTNNNNHSNHNSNHSQQYQQSQYQTNTPLRQRRQQQRSSNHHRNGTMNGQFLYGNKVNNNNNNNSNNDYNYDNEQHLYRRLLDDDRADMDAFGLFRTGQDDVQDHHNEQQKQDQQQQQQKNGNEYNHSNKRTRISTRTTTNSTSRKGVQWQHNSTRKNNDTSNNNPDFVILDDANGHVNGNNNNNNNNEHYYDDDPELGTAATGGSSMYKNENDTNTRNGTNDTYYRYPKPDSYAGVGNLDVYFHILYTYYYNRGLMPIIGRGVVEHVTLFFTLFLSIFLFLYFDWHQLLYCTDDDNASTTPPPPTCPSSLSSYIIQYPLYSNKHYTVWKCCIVLYSIIFALYSIISVLKFVQTINDAYYAKHVFEERLGIGEQKLAGGAVDWDIDIVQRLQQLQQGGQYRLVVNTDTISTSLSAHAIANRICRKENFLIALFNQNYLNCTIPSLFGPDTIFYCTSIEWSIYFCILNFMFNHKYELRPAFYMEPNALRRRFRICGIASVLLMPFFLFFMVVYFALQNAYDWKSTKQYLGPKDWSTTSKWLFREFNELQHLFERRLSPSYEATENYLQLFGTNEIITAIGRILVFIGGSLGIVIIALAAINDTILLHVTVYEWNLLWYAGVFGAIYSVGKAMIPDAKALPKSAARNLYGEINLALADVAIHTHYYPQTWKVRGWDTSIHSKVSSMFQVKVKLFLHELLSLLVSPYILCVSLPECSEAICDFILAIRSNIPGVGDVCGYATFDFTKFTDDEPSLTTTQAVPLPTTVDNRPTGSIVGSYYHYAQGRFDHLSSTINGEGNGGITGRSTGMSVGLGESVLQLGNVEEATRRYPTPKARYGKMKHSYLSFKATHPSWNNNNTFDSNNREHGRPPTEGTSDNVRTMSSSTREQELLHITAAARLIETLRQLEEQQQQQQQRQPQFSSQQQQQQEQYPLTRLYDSYIPKVPPVVATETATQDATTTSATTVHENGNSAVLQETVATLPPISPQTVTTTTMMPTDEGSESKKPCDS